LLLQSIGDVRTHLESPSESILSEAVINLGEALKQLQTAREDFDREAAKAASAG
jgi:hypothetical protein